jgi:phosphoserine phosphatase RsbU/P
VLSNKSILQLTFGLALISWILLVVADLTILFGAINNVQTGISPELPRLALDLFFVSVYFYYKYKIGKAESVNFIDMLWRVFMTATVTALVSLTIRLFFIVFQGTRLAENDLMINLLYHINMGLIGGFLISTFIVWKRLILYQKTKKLLFVWQFFEYSLLASIIFNFFDYTLFDFFFNFLFIFLLLLGLILSVNLKWVAYLNFKQKWKSILLIFLLILCMAYFSVSLVNFSNSFNLILDIVNNIFILSIFAFTLIYAVFSLLVILFNLPTSSVFEQKLEEVINFQRLSQSIQTGQNEQMVLEILMESSISAVMADAAWLETYNDTGLRDRMKIHQIHVDQVEKLKQSIKNESVNTIFDLNSNQDIATRKLNINLKGGTYRSILVVPIFVKNKQIGYLGLLKEVGDGFNTEMGDIIRTFVSQASISIENFQLLNEALDNERYKEELKIAKRVQSSLLPEKIRENEFFEIAAFSEAADEVGGDYYDFYQFDRDHFAIIIGDVSGKGTSAAFNMSQMKGVFHSLVQLQLPPDKFMILANQALGRCLEKSSFITASYFFIDAKNQQIAFTRAGHCPTLYFDAGKKESQIFKTKGLGLGIVRSESYDKYIAVNHITYKSGDVMLLYTDGVTEAKNSKGEEFGYERLKTFLHKQAPSNARLIKENLLKELYSFAGNRHIEDDYTALIVKFKDQIDNKTN